MLQQSKNETILKEETEENTLAIYLEDEPINYIPTKDSGYTLDIERSSCTNGVEVSFDYNTWSVQTNYSNYTYQNNERVKCNLYFKKISFAEAVTTCGTLGENASNCMKENSFLSNEIVSDETVDDNLRYIGADPENYVWFNDELWRIIGVMNNIDDGTGTKETRLKIIRDEPIGNYSWDYNTDGSYDNDWSTSTLMELLNNGAYYNRTTGIYYNQNQSTAIAVDFTQNGLTNESKDMIGSAIWNLGGVLIESFVPSSDLGYNATQTTSMWYQSERSDIIYQNRPTEWNGQVALMYPSDFGYATNGGEALSRKECLDIPLFQWISNDCYKSDWLYQASSPQWLLTPFSDSMAVSVATLYVGTGKAFYSLYSVSPVTYLISNIKITDGDGSQDNPYRLSLD